MSEKLKDQEQEEREDCVVVHVTEDGGPLTVTHKMGLAAASEFYDRITSRYIGQGGAYLCRVLHDADSQFPVARLSRQGAEGKEDNFVDAVDAEVRSVFWAGYTLSATHRHHEHEDDGGAHAAWTEYRRSYDPVARIAALRAQPKERRDLDDAKSAYWNLRTCICGEDARHHACPEESGHLHGFDPDWADVRVKMEARQIEQPKGHTGHTGEGESNGLEEKRAWDLVMSALHRSASETCLTRDCEPKSCPEMYDYREDWCGSCMANLALAALEAATGKIAAILRSVPQGKDLDAAAHNCGQRVKGTRRTLPGWALHALEVGTHPAYSGFAASRPATPEREHPEREWARAELAKWDIDGAPAWITGHIWREEDQ